MLEIEGRRILTTLEEKVGPERCALLVIDMQKDFTKPGQSSDLRGRPLAGIDELAGRLREFIERARSASVFVVHVMAKYDPEYLTDAMYERMHRLGFAHYCRSGTEGIEFHPGFEPLPGEPVVVKHRFDAFYDTELDILLKARGTKTVIATGVAAHGCVYATAAHAYFNGYYVVVPEDLTGLGGPVELTGAMISIRDGYGITPTAAEVLGCWQRVAGAASAAAKQAI